MSFNDAQVKRDLVFADQLANDDYKLFDLPEELLAQILHDNFDQDEIIFEIKGGGETPAVICTKDKTYAITKVETTNAVLLVNGNNQSSNSKLTVEGLLSAHYEIAQTHPQVQQLQSLLPYYVGDGKKPKKSGTLATNDKTRTTQLVTMETLEAMVPASHDEILQALKDLNAVDIDCKFV